MAARKDVPFNYEHDNEPSLEPNRPPNIPVGCAEFRAENEYEALMQAPPGHEPVVPREEMRQLRDVIVDAIDTLSDEDRYIFDACFVRRAPLRLLGEELGWGSPPHFAHTTVARTRDRIVQDLRATLRGEFMIRMYLRGDRR